MKFLTFDTSLDKTYVTLFDNEDLLETQVIESHDDKYHSAYLIQNLVTLLKKHLLTMQDINAIGVNVGPGSFTGIRACLTIARVIAQQLDIPLVGISSLELLAQINESKTKTTVVMDARKNMCYFAQYDEDGKTLCEPQLVELSALNIEKNNIVVSDNMMKEYLKLQGVDTICYTDINKDLGKYLGILTCKYLQQKGEHHWAKVKPLYLQKPSITMPKKNIL